MIPPPPDEVITLVNDAAAAIDADDPTRAIEYLQRAELIHASQPEIYNNFGNAHTALNQLDQAIPRYERALALRPDFPDAHLNLSMALLKKGEWERGWLEWEWRWATKQFVPFNPPVPRWQGQPLPNATLLIHTEQGAGDAMQFARFLPEAASRVGKLLLVAPDPLRPLLAAVPGVGEMAGAGEFTPDRFQAYASLMSLPQILGVGMTLATLPAQVPYLSPPADRTVTLPDAPPGHKRIGIAWAGSPTQGNDRNRSATLATFGPLLELPNISWYSLQVGEKAAELDEYDGPATIHDLRPQLNDWGDTAAAMQQLDLVIAVDTGVVHLAGALGKPVWVLLCYAPDWRWMLDRPDSPWYPTARLFRQPAPKNWDAVMEQVRQALVGGDTPAKTIPFRRARRR